MQSLTRIARSIGVRPDEIGDVALIVGVFAALEIGRGVGEVGATTLVWSRLPADALPWLYIGLGLLSMVVALAYGGALGRYRRGRLFAVTLIGIAAVLLIEVALITGLPDVIPVAWLTVMAAGTLAMTISWTVAGSTLDTRQAKRLFPLCTAAAIVGNLVGSLAAGPVTGVGGPALAIVVEAALFALAAALIVRLASRSRAPGWAAPPAVARSVVADLRAGSDEVRRSRLLSLVAIAYVLFGLLSFSVLFPYQAAAKSAFPDDVRFAEVVGRVAALATGLSFLVSLLIAKRFYGRFGIAAAALLLPIVYLAGFGLWIVAFSFPTAALVLVVLQTTQRGLSNAAWSAFYNVIPSAWRAQAMAFNDGVPSQVGTILSGVMLLTAARFLAPSQVFWIGLATAAACTAVVIAIRRRYAEALLRTLRSGAGERILEGGPGLGEMLDKPEVRMALTGALAAPEASTRELAASMLARAPATEVCHTLASVLTDPDPRVRGAAVLGVLGPGRGPEPDEAAAAETCLDRLFQGPVADRVAGLRALDRLERDLPADVRAAGLADASPEVRSATVAALRSASDAAVERELLHALDDPDPAVRRAAATVLAGRPDVAVGLVDRLGPIPDVSTDAVIAALEGHAADVHDAVLTWAEGQVERAVRLADARTALLAGWTVPRGSFAAMTTFLEDVLAIRVHRHQDLALAAMSTLGAPAAHGVIRRCLRSNDADIRAQAIEALDSIGDRRLGGAIARLVEHAPPQASPDGDAVVAALRDDDDRWIAAIARRVGPGGETVSDPERAVGDLDTMLLLHGVPLFERLGPEDLQRLAMVATERRFAPGEALVHEDELGDELFVILEGRVVVTRREPDGSERTLRTYGAGDHIGELAVLRERPRVATVRADGGSVRTLVVSGEGLTAILRERPDAAMAMLATLAERISTQ